MENKLTLEELKATYKALGEEIERKEKAEAEERRAKLAAEKETRFKEVTDAYKKADALRAAVVEDYGYYTYEDGTTPSLWDFFFKMR